MQRSPPRIRLAAGGPDARVPEQGPNLIFAWFGHAALSRGSDVRAPRMGRAIIMMLGERWSVINGPLESALDLE